MNGAFAVPSDGRRHKQKAKNAKKQLREAKSRSNIHLRHPVQMGVHHDRFTALHGNPTFPPVFGKYYSTEFRFVKNALSR